MTSNTCKWQQLAYSRRLGGFLILQGGPASAGLKFGQKPTTLSSYQRPKFLVKFSKGLIGLVVLGQFFRVVIFIVRGFGMGDISVVSWFRIDSLLEISPAFTERI